MRFDLIIFLKVTALQWLNNNSTSPEILFLIFNIPGCCSFGVAKHESIINVDVLKLCYIIATTFFTLFFFSSSSYWHTHSLSNNFYISSSTFSGPQFFKSLSIIRLHYIKACATIITPTSCIITPINNSANLLQFYSE